MEISSAARRSCYGSHSNYLYSASSCPQMRLRIASYYEIGTRYSIQSRLVLMIRLTVQVDKIVVNKIVGAKLKSQMFVAAGGWASLPPHHGIAVAARGPPSQLLQFMDSKRWETLTVYKFQLRLDIV